MDKNSIVMPEFKISKTGRVYCRKHTNFHNDEEKHFPEFDFLRALKGEAKLRCESCLHYMKDDCYFSKEVIKQIKMEMKGFRKHYKCDVCKGKIEFLSNVLYKLLSEQDSRHEIGLICCGCYSVLKNRESQEMINKAIFVMALPIIIGFALFIINAFISIELFLRNLIPNLLLIIPITLCALYPTLKMGQRSRKRKKWLKSTKF